MILYSLVKCLALVLVVENVFIFANETSPSSLMTVQHTHKIDHQAEDRSMNDHLDSINLDHLEDTIGVPNDASQISEDRISRTKKRKAKHPRGGLRNHHIMNLPPPHPPSNSFKYAKSPFRSKHRKKPRGSRKKRGPGSISKPPRMKIVPMRGGVGPGPGHPLQAYAKKPILLSELMRSKERFPPFANPANGGGRPPIIASGGPPIISSGGPPIIASGGPPSIVKDFVDEDGDLTVNPSFASDTFDGTFASGGGGGRPPSPPFGSIELSDDMMTDGAGLGPIEGDIIIAGSSNMRPYPPLSKPPADLSHAIFSPTKPPDIFVDGEFPPPDSMHGGIGGGGGIGGIGDFRNVRLPSKPNHNSYIDKDIVDLLSKIKSEGSQLDSKPARPATETTTNVNEAISKLLRPFLSDNAVRQIQTYFEKSSNEKRHGADDKNVTKVVYIIENNGDKDGTSNEDDYSASSSSKTFTIMEPVHEHETNNTTYFVMVKSPHEKIGSFQQHGTRLKSKDRKKYGTTTTSPSTTTPVTFESAALQSYIMSLAGLNTPVSNFLPRFNAYSRQFPDSMT